MKNKSTVEGKPDDLGGNDTKETERTKEQLFNELIMKSNWEKVKFKQFDEDVMVISRVFIYTEDECCDPTLLENIGRAYCVITKKSNFSVTIEKGHSLANINSLVDECTELKYRVHVKNAIKVATMEYANDHGYVDSSESEHKLTGAPRGKIVELESNSSIKGKKAEYDTSKFGYDAISKQEIDDDPIQIPHSMNYW